MPRQSARYRTRDGLRVAALVLAAGCGMEADGLDEQRSPLDGGRSIEGRGRASAYEAGTTTVQTIEPISTDASAPVDAALVVPAVPAVPAVTAEAACPAHGSFALRLEADVDWEGTRLAGIVPIIVPGNGKVVIRTLVDIGAPDQSGYPSHVRACDAEVPDFGASVGELYGGAFPQQVWDRLTTRWDTQAFFACAEPGCAFRSDLVIAQLGLALPTAALWPSPRDPLDRNALRDDDADGRPGVLLRMRGREDDARYVRPPTSFLLLERVRELDLAIRVGVALDGAIDSCDQRSGAIRGMTLELRALGCQLESGRACSEEELGFVDDNLPVWKVRSARFHATRLPAGASCARVREL